MTTHPEQDPERIDERLGGALGEALAARAGGSVDEVVAAPDDRLAAIEAAIADRPRPRTRIVTVAAAAALIVVLLGIATVGRGTDDSQLDLGGATTTTTDDGGPPGSGPPGTGPTSVVENPTGPPASVGAADPTTSTTSSTASPDTRIGDVDLRNFTYPVRACSANVWELNGEMAEPSFTLVDGQATMARIPATAYPQEYVMWLVDVVHGDVTGDGVDDAVVRLSCGLAASDGVWESLVVVSVVDGAPAVIGSLDRSGYAPLQHTTSPITGEEITYPEDELIVDVTTVDGQLVVRWNRRVRLSPPAAQRLSTVAYRWDGQTFVPQGETDVEDIPAPSTEVVPVEEIDFSSIWLDMQHIRPIENTVCGFAYRGIDVANSALVNWVAPVVDVTHARVGTVTMELLSFADLDRDGASEALVRFTCEGPRATVHTLGIYEAVPYGNVALRWTTTVEDGTFDDVTAFEVAESSECVLRVTYRSSSGAPGAVVRGYRPVEGGTFVGDPSCGPGG